MSQKAENSGSYNSVTHHSSNKKIPKDFSETDVFIDIFSSSGGRAYKICPVKWLVVDQGFGIDVTCCQGQCQPKSMQDIEKIVKLNADGTQKALTPKETFLRWALLVDK